jgi:LPXTG-motif cell wall-anchored protein
MARGNLPLTGLPVWIVFLAGMALLGLGKVLYRRRPRDAVDLIAH